jgi:hypothetical protein
MLNVRQTLDKEASIALLVGRALQDALGRYWMTFLFSLRKEPQAPVGE